MIDQEGNYPKSCFIEYDPETNEYCFTIEQFGYAMQECDSQRYVRADIAEQQIRKLEEVNAELYRALVAARNEINTFPRSMGYDITALPMIDAALAKVQEKEPPR